MVFLSRVPSFVTTGSHGWFWVEGLCVVACSVRTLTQQTEQGPNAHSFISMYVDYVVRMHTNCTVFFLAEFSRPFVEEAQRKLCSRGFAAWLLLLPVLEACEHTQPANKPSRVFLSFPPPTDSRLLPSLNGAAVRTRTTLRCDEHFF